MGQARDASAIALVVTCGLFGCADGAPTPSDASMDARLDAPTHDAAGLEVGGGRDAPARCDEERDQRAYGPQPNAGHESDGVHQRDEYCGVFRFGGIVCTKPDAECCGGYYSGDSEP